jgi:hypothetical protein
MAQPKMGLIRYLLGRTFYPDNSYTRDADGSPIRPYDMGTDTMAEFMGVRVDPRDEAVTAEAAKVARPVGPGNTVAATTGSPLAAAKGFGYSFDGRLNDSFRVLNLLNVPIFFQDLTVGLLLLIALAVQIDRSWNPLTQLRRS